MYGSRNLTAFDYRNFNEKEKHACALCIHCVLYRSLYAMSDGIPGTPVERIRA